MENCLFTATSPYADRRALKAGTRAIDEAVTTSVDFQTRLDIMGASQGLATRAMLSATSVSIENCVSSAIYKIFLHERNHD